MNGGILIKVYDMKQSLQSCLSVKRYNHTLGVVDEAIKISKHYGEDYKLAEISALLHDCAKDYPSDLKISMCKEYHVVIDDELRRCPELIHSFLGAEVARRQYKIDNEIILNAIRFHSTGRENMSTLEKIIYLADYIEPNRKRTEDLNEIRELTYEDLDAAMLAGLKYSIDYVLSKNKNLHSLSLDALKYYESLKGVKVY